MPTKVTVAHLIDHYDVLLLDAYGVLVHSGGAMPGAAALLRDLVDADKRYLVVTNDAARLPETSAARYQSFGLQITAEQLVTSGQLLADANLAGARCLVLGTRDTEQYVTRAGAQVVALDASANYDAVVVGDDAGYPFLDAMDTTLTALFRHGDRGAWPRLILPNPDLVYSKGENSFGFTAGGAAMLLEAALARRFPQRAPQFERLGKPYAPMFQIARRRAGPGRLVMIGDQLETDIAGARAAGIDAALVTTGVTRWSAEADRSMWPTYLLDSLHAAT